MDPNDNRPAQAQLNIEVPEDVADGTFSNLVMIAHSPEEFILDFIRVMPGMPKARVKSRIIVTPAHARRLLDALDDNIAKYEAQFGSIEQAAQQPPFGFVPPGGEA